MKLWDKEFYELMNQFEKDLQILPYTPSVERVIIKPGEKAPVGEYYNNGETNKLFTMYMAGYLFAKQLSNY